MNRGRSYFISVSLTAAGFTLIGPAIAQEVGGLTATFGISQGIEASDNFDLDLPEESGARSVTSLSFGLSSVTNSSSISLVAAGDLELGNTNDDAFNDRSLTFDYSLTRKNSTLDIDARYALTDVNAINSTFEFDPTSIFGLFSEQFFVGDGTRERTTANFRFETGIDAPLGFIFQGAYNFTDFQDTNDPDLFQTETFTAKSGGVGANL